MAIPENYIDKITKDGDSRIISPSADNVRVNNENFEGADLDEVLDEVAQAIDDAGDGTVTGVKIGDMTYGPTDGVVDLSTPMGGKVDKETGKGLSSNDYTDAEKSKLGALPTKAELDAALAEAGKVKTVSINGETKRPDASGNVDLGTVVGEKGDKGDTGNVEFEGLDDLVALLVNDLTTGGAGNFLSAEMGKRLKAKIEEVNDNIRRLYNNLGNVAFWDAASKTNATPSEIDWGNPKHNVTLALTLTNAVVKRNGTTVANGDAIRVEEFSTLNLIIEPTSGYAFIDAPTASASGIAVVVSDNGDGTYTVGLTMGQSDVTLAISASCVQSHSISYNLAHIKSATRPSSIPTGGTAVINMEAETNYALAVSDISVNNATLVSYTGNVLTISNPTGDVTIEATAIFTMKLLRGWYIGTDSRELTNAAITGSTIDVDQVVTTDYIKLPQADVTNASLMVNYGVASDGKKDSTQGPPSIAAFFKLEDGAFKIVGTYSWTGANSTSRTVVISGDVILGLLREGNLYLRSNLAVTEAGGNTLFQSCAITWRGSVLFSASSAYTITTDTNQFEPFTK